MAVAASTAQATVATFDSGTRTGTVLLDTGRPVDFDRAAFDAGGLLTLRSGQRVRLEHAPNGTVIRVTIHTLV